jgi:hypothetical protein
MRARLGSETVPWMVETATLGAWARTKLALITNNKNRGRRYENMNECSIEIVPITKSNIFIYIFPVATESQLYLQYLSLPLVCCEVNHTSHFLLQQSCNYLRHAGVKLAST